MESEMIKRIAATCAVLGLATIGVAAAPKPANAWWNNYGYCCGVVVPPVVVAPVPVYAPPPPAYYAPPARVWIPGHYQYGYWVPGHWS
jgi:hypothetical protein